MSRPVTVVNWFGTSEIQRHSDQVQQFRKDTAIGYRNSGKTLQLGPGIQERYCNWVQELRKDTPGIQERHCKEQEEINIHIYKCYQGLFAVRVADTAASDLSDKSGFDGAPACSFCLECVCRHASVTLKGTSHFQGISLT
jgi:hypothetical protein